MSDRDHALLCRAYGPAPARTVVFGEPLSDYAFWRERMADRRGEVCSGCLTAGAG